MKLTDLYLELTTVCGADLTKCKALASVIANRIGITVKFRFNDEAIYVNPNESKKPRKRNTCEYCDRGVPHGKC